MKSQFVIREINPIPWKAPNAAVQQRGKKRWVQFYSPEEMKTYKEAIGAEVQSMLPLDWEPWDQPFLLEILFWRWLEPYTTHQARTARKHQADATNLMKATEDALQGVLFTNDRNAVGSLSWIMEQDHETEPLIVINFETNPKLPKYTIEEQEDFDGKRNIRAELGEEDVI